MKLEGESWAHYLAGAIGRYVNSDADSDLRREAREKLFDAYGDWCEAGRPSDGTSAEDEVARLQAALRDAAGAPGSTCTLSGEVGPEEWLRRHWRNALDNWMFWRDAYRQDIGEPDAPFPWQSWRVSAERAKADAARWRVIARDLEDAIREHRKVRAEVERLRAVVRTAQESLHQAMERIRFMEATKRSINPVAKSYLEQAERVLAEVLDDE